MPRPKATIPRPSKRAAENATNGFRWVPFGGESRCREATGLRSSELAVVVCLVAAEATGHGLVTIDALAEKTTYDAQSIMAALARGLWVESPDKVTESRKRLWRATPHAWRRLGFYGWQVVLFTKEALEGKLHLRAIADDVYREHLRKCAARGEVIDVEGEEVPAPALPERAAS